VLTAVVTTTLSLGASIALFGEQHCARNARPTRDRGADVEIHARSTRSDGATYASTYTVDGQFGNGTNATKGREALSKLVVRQPAAGEPPRAPLYHMELNHWIEFMDKDHARYHAYYLTVAGALGRETPPRLVAAGQSFDEMERVNGKWLLKTRDVAAKD
jgi:hypothetical protein